MKTRMFWTACMLFGAAACPLLAEEAKNPDIKIAERVFNAGDVMKGEKIVHDFNVKNDGQAPLQIFDARPSCGCTVTDFDRTIMPGKTGTVHAVIDTNRVGQGAQSKTITVSSNDPDEAQILLQLKANVVSLATVLPATLFLRADRLHKDDISFFVHPHETNPFKVKGVSSDLPFLSFDVSEVGKEGAKAPRPGLNPQEGDYEVKVTIDPKAPLGDVEGTIKVLTSSKKTPEVQVPVRGSINGLITAIPRRVYLQVRSPNSIVTSTEDVLKVRRDPSIESPEVAEVKKGIAMRVLPTPANLAGDSQWLRIQTPDHRIGWVFAKFTEPLKGAATPKLNNSRTIQVRKKEGDPFEIKKARATMEGVKVETNTVEAGRAYSVTITYEGDMAQGTHSGDIILETNDKDEPTIKVPLYVHIT